ncbi:YwdI family protein [Jeotgalibacillus proteolyticus]|uniref:YwdI family protein n=1 Tax=Jeotgalibacillus proteolyticus TaxID=2082395 RepID=A0A2S5G9M2_9BACL|nr:YwdI family protein [Jeotgalibacillus proteolyticus]PPA69702.1 hypothetical protein C4B60_14265 [Jeotgalibacillus proteolyticus]
MSISEEKLLLKIEQQIGHAKQASASQRREHLHAIRTLCDLMLDNGTGTSTQTAVSMQQPVQPVPQPVFQPQSQPSVSIPKEKPMQMDDGSNGDSLFDF